MSNNPFGDQPNQQYPQNPYQAPHQGGPQGYGPNPQMMAIEKEISSQATAALVVGIISFFFCGIVLAPFAIYRGSKALNLIKQYNVGQQHSGSATAGKIIGIIVLVLNILVLIAYAVFFSSIVATQR